MHFWKIIQHTLVQHKKLALLYVLDSSGSSPGRQGFKMMVTEKGKMHGSIGGGIMEHKLIELAKSKLAAKNHDTIFKQQIHSKEVNDNQSGMICSGEQSVAILFLWENEIKVIDQINLSLQKGEAGTLDLSPNGISFNNIKAETAYAYQFTNEQKWTYKETIGYKKFAFIVGGGHVSSALTQVLNDLEFHCTIIDDRHNLNTLEENASAHVKKTLAYSQLNEHIPDGKDVFIFIMTFGYRSDLEVLQQLVNKNVAFLGMMGSEEKVKQLLDDMRKLNYSEEQLDKIHTPIGLAIKSRTPHEIAISIAAQVIQLQNKDLP